MRNKTQQKRLANEFLWLYVAVFLAIPLVRVLPRIIRRLRGGYPASGGYADKAAQRWGVQATHGADGPQARPQSDEMLILGQMIGGAKTFEAIRKYTQLSDRRLDAGLQDLESRGMIRVERRQGLLGPRVEIHPTSKGLREFHN